MGDIAMATPLITAIRRAYPQAFIAWLVQSGFEDLLNAHPDLNAVIPWDRRQWQQYWSGKRLLKLAKSVLQLRRQLHHYHFDMVIDTQGLLKSGFFSALSGARKRIGVGSKEGSQWLMHEVVRVQRNDPRISSEYMELARYLGLPLQPFTMHIEVTADDKQFAQNSLHERQLDRFCVVLPFTTRAQKHWPAEHWISLASQLWEKHGLKSLILGGPGDRDNAQAMSRQCEHLYSLAGDTRIRQAQALIRKATIAIGVDTGLTHMSLAAGIPTVILFGSTRPYLETPGYHSHIIYHALACSPCRRKPTCQGSYHCMGGIRPNEVLQTVKRMLGTHENTAS